MSPKQKDKKKRKKALRRRIRLVSEAARKIGYEVGIIGARHSDQEEFCVIPHWVNTPCIEMHGSLYEVEDYIFRRVALKAFL